MEKENAIVAMMLVLLSGIILLAISPPTASSAQSPKPPPPAGHEEYLSSLPPRPREASDKIDEHHDEIPGLVLWGVDRTDMTLLVGVGNVTSQVEEIVKQIVGPDVPVGVVEARNQLDTLQQPELQEVVSPIEIGIREPDPSELQPGKLADYAHYAMLPTMLLGGDTLAWWVILCVVVMWRVFA